MIRYNVFHSSWDKLRHAVHVVLVRPEQPGNVGSVARAMANMGIEGKLFLVGSERILTEEAYRLAKHAGDRLESSRHVGSLGEVFRELGEQTSLKIASTARSGSAHRPHPLSVREGVERAVRKLKNGDIFQVALVFGPESDGLTNDEVGLCDWIVTIPSHAAYRSLNLSQAVLIFCYEIQSALLEAPEEIQGSRPSQKERLIRHVLRVAEEVQFVLPGDPFKMRPRLERIFGALPNHIRYAATLHGLLDQVSRSVRGGSPDVRGRFRRALDKMQSKEGNEIHDEER